MNKTNGFKEQASASTSLYNKEQTKPKPTQRSPASGLSFLKWFKKSDKSTIDSRCSTKSVGRNFHNIGHNRHNHFNNSHETLSPPSSPNLEYLSPSSSCDSIKSTSTTGFAFVRPSNYRPSNDIAQKTLFPQEFEADGSYRTLSRAKPDLTLRRKYCLYDADTLTSTEGDYDNIRFGDRSLPHLRKQTSEQRSLYRRRRTRRAVSDSSKDKKSGAYVHVKGKRKAPPPPTQLVNGSTHNETPNRSLTTLNRKKRKAPPPPSLPSSPSNSLTQTALNGYTNNMDLKALLRAASPNSHHTDTSEDVVMRTPTQYREDISPAQKLTEQQKQIVLDNIVNVTQTDTTSAISETETKAASPNSPISPRPWYKRPISSNRDSSVPFKREVALKTMEKRKSKQKEKTPKNDNLPETTHSRSSLFDASSKLGFFLRGKDHTEKDKEKRRSGIGIPNISELDREAAEIINREYASVQAVEKTESEKFFAKSDHIMLQQEMFGSKTNIDIPCQGCKPEENEEEIKSTKELISKFEATTNGPRVTLNTSFIGRKENFVKQSSKDTETKVDIEVRSGNVEVQKDCSNGAKINKDQPKPPEIDTELKEILRDESSDANVPDNNGGTILSWSCAFCTLENPGWRIICEVCEHIKPYEKRTSIENKVNQNVKSAVAMPVKQENLNENLNSSKVRKPAQSNEWDKKTEKVLKYFIPRTTNNNPLAKSSSETSVGKYQFFRKSPSPGKPPSGSPQLGLRNRLANGCQVDVKKSVAFTSGFNKSAGTISEEKENYATVEEKKKPLLDSSVIVTTVVPVFYASTTLAKNPDVAIIGNTGIPGQNEENNERIAGEVAEVGADIIVANGTKSQKAEVNGDFKKEEINIVSHQPCSELKIDVKEVRKVRLAKFSVPQVGNVSTEPIPIRDYDSLEREKKRLREMIQAMNAKALAEKYPTAKIAAPTAPIAEEELESPVAVESGITPIQTAQFVQTTSNSNDQAKSGAIKKVFAKNKNLHQPSKSPDLDFVKPKKVSTSVQTSGVMKKSLTPEDIDKLSTTNIYANMPIYENSPLEKFDRIVRLTENDRAEMQEISQKLTSVQGINDFKASLENPLKGISATDTIALSKIMRNLETAIAEGQHELAAQIAMDLARMKVSLHVTKLKDRPTSRMEQDFEKNINVNMFVEDKYSQKGPIQISVTSLYTISNLKTKIATDFDIPIEAQRWLINDDLALENDKTLLEFGVKDDSATFYLYIVAPDIHFYEVKKTNVDKTQLLPKPNPPNIMQTVQITPDLTELGAAALPKTSQYAKKEPAKGFWSCSLCTLINSPERNTCLACTKPKPKETKIQHQIPKLKPTVQLRSTEKKNDLNKTNPIRKSTDVFNIVDIKIDVKKTVTDQIKPLSNADSPNITRSKYRGVDNFNPNRKKGLAPQPGQGPRPSTRVPLRTNQRPTSPKKADQNKNHYQELLSLDNADVVPNIESFECPVCFMKFDTGEGVILRDCLHTFCKECLAHTVQYSEDAEIRCPYMDAEYSCDSVLQEREVRALVTKDIYELHLVKSMRVAEHQIENTFHCKTPNCRGWCIYEDDVNEFKCPVCRIINCLTCRVIHDGLTCKQYQDRLNSDCDSNIDAKRTKEMLEEMVKNGEAMNCPTCQVIMMKKWGCDWLKCSMCKTEVCWVTRGPRWGPAGKGDTSAGCRCGVNNVKCHPKCSYCH